MRWQLGDQWGHKNMSRSGKLFPKNLDKPLVWGEAVKPSRAMRGQQSLLAATSGGV
jgi:hypothetical protein